MTYWRKGTLSAVARSPFLEALEPRMMLSGNKVLWGGDAHLTLSFAPDGTKIAGLDSSLAATMNAIASEEQWQEAILRAFQTWAVETNASIGVTTDSGADFGSSGASRADSRFGDIRIGAAPLADGVYAISIPSDDILSGTWVGDVIFNSHAELTTLEEVFAVALHEAGHVFGLEHSDDPLSPMYVHGITPMTELTAGDVAAIQLLYGSPQPDLNERANGNDSLSNATQLRLNSTSTGGAGTAPSLAYGSITTPGDVDYFRLSKPGSYTGPITFQLQSQGISLLAPRLTIFDSKGSVLGQAVSVSTSGDKLTITLSETPSDGQFFVEATGGRSDAFGRGGYSLAAVFEDINLVAEGTIDQAAGGALWFLSQQELAKLFMHGTGEPPDFYDDGHSDDAPAASVKLTPSPGFPNYSRYETYGSVADAADVDFYRVTAPAAHGGVLTIRVRALENPGLLPKIAVFDQNGVERPVQVLVNGSGELVIQLSGIQAREMVTFSVASQPLGAILSDNYQLLADFGDDAAILDQTVSGSLSAAAPIRETPLYVALPQLFHFALAVPAGSSADNAAVMVTIRNADGEAVHRVAARPGETRTAGSVLLKPGSYTVEVAALSVEPLAVDLAYALHAKISSDPFAADPDDPTFDPEFQCSDPEHAGFYCYPGGFMSPDPYLWDDFTESLPEPPAGQTFQETVQSLLAEWWTWLWQQMGMNGPPLARNDAFNIQTSTATTLAFQALATPPNVLENDIEPEQEGMIAVLRSTTAHGQLTLNLDGTFIYLPDPGFAGVDSFTYAAVDSINESSEAVVRIYVGFRGDYDSSGVVDGGDFLAWQRGFGQSVSPAGSGADGDGDGLVTQADGSVWAYNFGAADPNAAPIGESGDGELVTVSADAEIHVAPLAAGGEATVRGAYETLSLAYADAGSSLLHGGRFDLKLPSATRIDFQEPRRTDAELSRRNLTQMGQEIATDGETRTVPVAAGEPAQHPSTIADRALDQLFGRPLPERLL